MEEVLKHYPSYHHLNEEEQSEVNSLLKLQPSKKNHIQAKFGKLVTLKDIQNMKLKDKELERQGRTDVQMTIDKLSISLQNDPSAKSGVIMAEDNELAILYYQSGLMGEWFNKFPEISMIDGMVEDGHGLVQVVHYAATSSEDSNHIVI